MRTRGDRTIDGHEPPIAHDDVTPAARVVDLLACFERVDGFVLPVDVAADPLRPNI